MNKIDDKLSYILELNGKFYKSRRNYISIDFELVDHEIDTTPIYDLDDLIYLWDDLSMNEWEIHIILGNLCLTKIDLHTFMKLAIEGENL